MSPVPSGVYTAPACGGRSVTQPRCPPGRGACAHSHVAFLLHSPSEAGDSGSAAAAPCRVALSQTTGWFPGGETFRRKASVLLHLYLNYLLPYGGELNACHLILEINCHPTLGRSCWDPSSYQAHDLTQGDISPIITSNFTLCKHLQTCAQITVNHSLQHVFLFPYWFVLGNQLFLASL